MKLAIRRVVALALVVGGCGVCATDAACAEPLRFRRVYVPADRPELWPRDSGRYVPMDAAEFEDLVRSLREVPPGMSDLGQARLLHAEYEARLVEPDLLQGRAVLHWEHQGAEPVLASLEGWGLPLSSAAWEDADSPAPLIGTGPHGSTLVLVDRPGTLVASWTLRGQTEGEGAVNFPLALAKTAVSSLALELPLPLAPAFSAGVSRQVPAVAEGWRRWRVDLGGTRTLRVLVAGSQTQPQQRRLTLVEEQTTYDISPRGVDVLMQFKLDVHHEPLERLVLSLDPNLELVGVRYADAPLVWKLAGEGGEAIRRAIVDLPEPLLGTGRVLRVAALAPLAVNVRSRLPRVHVEDTIWQAGRINLLVRAPLAVNELEPFMCRQSRTGPLAGAIEGEMLELDAFSPEAAIELSVTRPPTLPSVRSAAVVSVAEDELREQVQLELRWPTARPRTLELHVAPGWLIEEVATTPTEALGEWEFLPLGAAGGMLRLPVAQGEDAATPLHLTVRGRRPRAEKEDAFADRVLEMLRLPRAHLSSRYLALHSLGPYELHVEPEDLHETVDRSQLAEEERALLESAPGLLFRLAPGAAAWRVRLVPQPPRYRARIQLETRVSDNEVLEQCRIHCLPSKAPLGRVLVHFTQPSRTPPQWTVDVRPGQACAVQRLQPAKMAELGLDSRGETWELSLAPPHEGPLRIEARRRLPRADAHALGLVCVPQAQDQEGLLLIRSTNGQTLRIENNRLVAAPLHAPLDPVNLCAALRYDPAREAAPALQPAVRIHTLDAHPQPPRTYVSELRLDSFADTSGRTQHRLTGTVRSGGLASCSLVLPGGAMLVSVRVNGRAQPAAPQTQHLNVQLDPTRRWQRLQVQYETVGTPLRLFSRWQADWPAFDLPVAQRTWTLWLPPAMVCARPSTRVELAPRSWLPRLLGGLVRPKEEPVFHPLSLASWREAVVECIEWLVSSQPSRQLPMGPYTGWQPTQLFAGGRQPPEGISANTFDGRSVTVWVARRATRNLANLSALLAAIALVRWRAGNRGWLAVWLLMLLFMALTLPQGMHSVVACAMQGTLLGLAWNTALPRPRPTSRLAAGQCEGSVPRALATRAGVLGLLLVVIVGTAAPGQPPATQAPAVPPSATVAHEGESDQVPSSADAQKPPARRVYPVLIPVDEQQRPTGDRYHVPEEFRNRLRERAMEVRGQPRGWLMYKALYTGSLVRDVAQGRLRLAGLTAAFTVRVFAPGTRLAIAFGPGEAAVQTELATLDGNPIEVHWDAGTRLLRTEPLEAGEHVLELPLVLEAQSLGLRDGILACCPRVCQARLELALPADAEDVLVPEARGAQGRAADGRQLWAELGPVDAFSVRWLSQVPTPAQAAVTLEQLVWLRLQPGSVAAEIRFRFDLQNRQLDRLRLLVDQRLRMLPLDAPQGQGPTIRTLPREPRLPRDVELVELQFPQPLTGKQELVLPFLVVGTTGVGSVRLPRIEVLDAVTSRVWVGVLVDAALEYTLPDAELAPPVKASDFAAVWGDNAPPLDFAVELLPGQPLVSVVARRRSPITTVEQQLAFIFGNSGAGVEYTAQLETRGGVVFQHHLDVPAEFQVEQVVLRLTDREVGVRWVRTPAGGIAVFFKEPVEGQQELRVQGWLPAADGVKLPAAAFRLRSVETRRTTVHLRREGSALVSAVDPGGVTEIVPPPEGGVLRGWPVKSFVIDGSMPELAVEIRPNQARMRATQVSWIERTSDGWMVHVEIQAEAIEGLLDELRLEISPDCQGPFEVLSASGETGAGRAVVRTTPTRRLLLVRLRHSAAALTGVHLRGAWNPPTGDTVALPQISLLDAETLARFVLLPQRLGRERATWSTDRLLPEALPVGLPFSAPAVPWESFRVLADPYRAILRPEAPAAGRPRIRHAETSLTWLEQGRCIGQTILDVEPAGAPAIQLHVPPGVELLHCALDGIDATLVRHAPTRWQISLAQQPLPLRIELAFNWTSPPLAAWRPETVFSPSPAEVAMVQWLWIVRAPHDTLTPVSLRPLSVLELERQRLRDLSALIANAADALARRGGEDAECWYRTWAGRLRNSQLRLLGWAEKQDAPQRDAVIEEIGRSVREQDAVALRLKLQHVWQQIKERTKLQPPSIEGVAFPESAAPASHSPADWLMCGESSTPRLQMQPPLTLRTPWQTAGILLLLTCIGAWILARRLGPDWSWRWSRLLLASAGLAWWLWLRPAPFGLFICLLVLLAGAVPAWGRTREPGSTLQVVAD